MEAVQHPQIHLPFTSPLGAQSEGTTAQICSPFAFPSQFYSPHLSLKQRKEKPTLECTYEAYSETEKCRGHLKKLRFDNGPKRVELTHTHTQQQRELLSS